MPPTLPQAIARLKNYTGLYSRKSFVPRILEGCLLCDISSEIWNAAEGLMLEGSPRLWRQLPDAVKLLERSLVILKKIPLTGPSVAKKAASRRLRKIISAVQQRHDELEVLSTHGKAAFQHLMMTGLIRK